MNSLQLSNKILDDINIVIFDKDGTLIDIHHYWCSMIQFRAKFFINEIKLIQGKKYFLYNDLVDNMGIDLQSNKMKPEGPVGLKPRSFIIDVALNTIKKYNSLITREMVSDVFDRVDIFSKNKLMDIVKVLDGAVDILKELKKKQIVIAIATTDLSERATLAMQSLGLEGYFNTIAGANLVKNAKPSADLVEFILDKHQGRPENTVVIGDAMADLGMAKNANVRFIGVKTGLFTDEFLAKSDYLVNTLKEIKVK